MTVDFFDVRRADALAAAHGCSGCAEHGDPACLCDVVVDAPTPVVQAPPCLIGKTEDRATFVNAVEMMLGGVDLVDMDRVTMATRGYNNLPTLSHDLIEAVWSFHADPDISLSEAAEYLGLARQGLQRVCRALGLEWVTHTTMRRGEVGRCREMYLRLRRRGMDNAEAMAEVCERTGVRLNAQTSRLWWMKEKASA